MHDSVDSLTGPLASVGIGGVQFHGLVTAGIAKFLPVARGETQIVLVVGIFPERLADAAGRSGQ